MNPINVHSTEQKPAEADLERTSSHANYTVWLLIMACAVYTADKVAMGVVIEPIGREFGLHDTQRGLLTGLAYGVAFAATSVPIGMLVDRYSRKVLLSILLALWSGLTVLSGFALTLAMLLTFRVIIGAAEAGALPTSMSLLADLVAPRRRATVIGFLYVGIGVGASAAALLGASLADHFGWRAIFWMAGGPGLIIAALIFLTVKEPKRGALDVESVARPPRAAPPLLEVARFFLSQRALIHTIIASTCAATAMAAMNVWTAPFFMRAHGMSLSGAGLVLAGTLGPGVIGGSMIGGVAGDALSRRGGPAARLWLAAGCSLICIPITYAMLETKDASGAAGLLLVWTVLAGVFFAPAAATIVNLTRPEMRGVMLSTKEVLANLVGLGMGPLIVGRLSDSLGGAQSLKPAILTVLVSCLVLSGGNFALATRTVRADLMRAAG
jgi:predicted MFS family arabinose efflux permease